MAVEGGQGSLDETADQAEQAVRDVGGDVLGSVDDQDNLGQNAEASEALDVSTDLGTDVDVVLATLGAVGNAVIVALAEAELAGETLDELKETEGQVGLDVSSGGGKTKEVGVEGNGSIDDALKVETAQTSADVLQVGADVGIDVDLGFGRDFELNVGRGAEGNSVEAGLAVLVVGVVLDDLGGRGSTVGAELDIDSSVCADVWLGPGTRENFTNTDVGIGVELLAGRAGTGLGPGAVAHGLGALVAGVLLASNAQVDIGIDIDLGVSNGSNFNFSVDVDIGTETNEAGGRGDSGEASEGSDEMHVD